MRGFWMIGASFEMRASAAVWLVSLSIPTLLLRAGDPAECVPAWWRASSESDVARVLNAGVDCALVEPEHWGLIRPMASQGLRAYAVVRTAMQALSAIRTGAETIVVDGPVSEEIAAATRGVQVIELSRRSKIRLSAPILATGEGLWPGIHIDEASGVAAGPTGSPWIDTNSGFLRYLRAASAYAKPVWIAQRAPSAHPLKAADIARAIADARAAGAHWVIDASPESLEKVSPILKFYALHRQLVSLPDYGLMGVVQDAGSGALLSGGILDMIAARHAPAIPLRPGEPAPAGLRLILDLASSGVVPASSKTAIMPHPAGWRELLPPPEAITFEKERILKLDEIYRDVNRMIGRRNLGVRVFNASGLLSFLKSDSRGGSLVVHLVNYTDYPVESVTVHALGQFGSARLLKPGVERMIETYSTEDGTGMAIDHIETVALLELKK